MRSSLAIGIIMLGPLASWAMGESFDIKPGLWNMTSTTQMSGMPPIPNLDKMTPEQRARVEQAMKNMTGTPHSTTQKRCITKESIDKAIANANNNKSCTTKVGEMSATRVSMHLDCSSEKGEAKTTGDILIERLDREHFKGSGAMKSTGSGHTMDIKWSMVGAYVSSDCGDVKPDGQ